QQFAILQSGPQCARRGCLRWLVNSHPNQIVDMCLDNASTLDERRTQRLLLRRVVPEDFDDLARLYRNATFMATLGGARTPVEAAHHLERQVEHWRAHRFGLWIARDYATGEFLGYGGLRSRIVEDKPEVEILYGLIPECWGQGIATEIGRE